MRKGKRLFLHSVFWIVVWALLGLSQGLDTGFLRHNTPVFLAQIIVVALVIYFFVPKLLIEKKHILFFTLAIFVIALNSWWSTALLENVRAPLSTMLPPENLPKPPSKIMVTTLFLSVAFIIATATELFLFVQRKQQELTEQKNEILQTELKLLKSQINPHFLFNALNNIYALSVTNSDKTQASISHLSTMLRYVLYECDRPLVPVSKEIEYLNNYIELFVLKSSRKFNISTSFQLENESLQIAPMLLIPFVENAFKHSHIDQQADSFVTIRVEGNTSDITIKIENSIPKTAMTTDAVGGIGLGNVKRRLEVLYPNKHELQVNSSIEVFQVSLHLDVDENN